MNAVEKFHMWGLRRQLREAQKLMVSSHGTEMHEHYKLLCRSLEVEIKNLDESISKSA